MVLICAVKHVILLHIFVFLLFLNPPHISRYDASINPWAAPNQAGKIHPLGNTRMWMKDKVLMFWSQNDNMKQGGKTVHFI